MGKRSGYMDVVERKYALAFQRKINMLLQMCEDGAVIAAGDVLGLDSEKYQEFVNTMRENVNEISDILLTDLKDDKKFVYTQEKVDRALKPIAGEKFRPWEDRY